MLYNCGEGGRYKITLFTGNDVSERVESAKDLTPIPTKEK